MAGLYFHIPFCKRKCHYCDFFSQVRLSTLPELMVDMLDELRQRSHYLQGQTLHTVYFGGGTPSLLDRKQIEAFIEDTRHHFHLSPEAEITLEANPDDINPERLTDWLELGINRLSIGIQSFSDQHLQWMNRRHDAATARNAVEISRKAGFRNISIDLIYGFQHLSNTEWSENLLQAFSLGVQHLSAYQLTLEPKTVFHRRFRQGEAILPPEESVIEQLEILSSLARQHGFEHYEISNFALPGFYSRHNLGYWSGQAYLGIGPSAHSFDGSSRQWNISDMRKYSTGIRTGNLSAEVEWLSPLERFNELIITRLRTQWGLDSSLILASFGENALLSFERKAGHFREKGQMIKVDHHWRFSPSGFLLADGIMASLMADQEEWEGLFESE